MGQKGIVMIHTGDGKGKTTAALGLMLRNIGWGKKVCVIQFLKSPEFECGEKLFCREHKIELISTGIGYSWTKTPQEQREALQKAWALAKSKILDSQYDFVMLDEINNVLAEKNFDVSDILTDTEVIAVLKQRPEHMNVVLTGRNAGEMLIEYADLVTEMRLLKHPYEKGIPATKGIEY